MTRDGRAHGDDALGPWRKVKADEVKIIWLRSHGSFARGSARRSSAIKRPGQIHEELIG